MKVVALARVSDSSGLERGDNVIGFDDLSTEGQQQIRLRFGDVPPLAYLNALATPRSGTGGTVPIATLDEDETGVFALITVTGPPLAFQFLLASSADSW
jgi:hypothetical protein